MNSKPNKSGILIKNKPAISSKIMDMQEDSLPIYKTIKEIINSGEKDTGRLYHILNALKQDKPLYKSDRQYLDDCILDFLDSKRKKISNISKFNYASKTSTNAINDVPFVSKNIIPINQIKTFDNLKNLDIGKLAENDISVVMNSVEISSNKIEDLRREYENGTSILESRDQTLTSHINSLNSRFEDTKSIYEKNETT